MLEKLHDHITQELNQNTRTDTIFILTAIILNLITLAINSGFGEQSRKDSSYFIVMMIFVALIILVNIAAVFGLIKGKHTKAKLITGLFCMYKDQNVDKYYDKSLISNYNVRYNLFIMVVAFTGVIAIIVPFIIR